MFFQYGKKYVFKQYFIKPSYNKSNTDKFYVHVTVLHRVTVHYVTVLHRVTVYRVTVHFVTVLHRNKFFYNKTNQMHQFPKFTPA